MLLVDERVMPIEFCSVGIFLSDKWRMSIASHLFYYFLTKNNSNIRLITIYESA